MSIFHLSMLVCTLASPIQCHVVVPPVEPTTSLTACQMVGMLGAAPRWSADHPGFKVMKILCGPEVPHAEDAA